MSKGTNGQRRIVLDLGLGPTSIFGPKRFRLGCLRLEPDGYRFQMPGIQRPGRSKPEGMKPGRSGSRAGERTERGSREEGRRGVQCVRVARWRTSKDSEARRGQGLGCEAMAASS